ncbi:hypothetical protein D8674_030357 [Pyrus ussuriensis x Pyrus communis]|uniref:Integrase catalytic domain-containing protein n=1 Tax=Pyrus ussuriensis x Pyrus communis TaxID=2448454 RepID=A0A5N5EVW5_9ROSA|nr:hypothetical protein D8674_030357 [Pyrus ussuriensis x Pyrus communis]
MDHQHPNYLFPNNNKQSTHRTPILQHTSESISDNDVMIAGLAGLPKEFGVIRTVILARESTLTLKEFRALLLGTEREIESDMNIVTQNMSALYVQGSSSGPATGSSSNTGSHSSASSSISHSHAHIPAVTAGTITVVPCDSLSSLPPPPVVHLYLDHSPQMHNLDHLGIITGVITTTGVPTITGIIMVFEEEGIPQYNWGDQDNLGMSPQSFPQDTWIVDSGVSHHITSDISALSQVKPFEGSEKITIGNGTGLPIKHIGSTKLQTPTHSLILNKVLHVPNIARSLLSVKQLCAYNNSWFICDESAFFVQDKKTREIVYQGKSRPDELFQTSVVISAKDSQHITRCPAAYLGKAVKNNVWHQRLGHPAHDVMTFMLKQSNIPVQTDDNHNTYISCIQGKMSRLPFPVRTARCTSPFQKVHTDVWGPTPVRSIEGYRYYVTFVDEYTRFVWIFLMSNKSDVFTIFVQFYQFVLTQFGIPIKSLQTDGGGEYTSKRFSSFLAAKGILQLISCPYTPQQNGVAERKHRHILDTAITLLSASGLPSVLWYFACAHSVRLINNMPCKSLCFSSPHLSLYKKVPDIQFLKIFGYAVFPCLRPYNSNKLQPRSVMCAFLGYYQGYKGVICYNLQTKKLVISRHVCFDESLFPARMVSHTSLARMYSHEEQEQPRSVPVIVTIPVSHSQRNTTSAGSHQSLSQSGVDLFSPNTTSSEEHISPEPAAQRSGTSLVHSSSPVTTSLLPVIAHAQLQEVIPSTSPSHTTDLVPTTIDKKCIQTRLRTGAISRKSFVGCLASLPQLRSLHLDDLSPDGSSTTLSVPVSRGFSFIADISNCEEPRTFKAASLSSEWQTAMQEEFNALKSQGTWILVPPPSHRSVIGSKLVYKVKKNPDGNISRFKARLVAQGYTQKQGLDYSETFSPVVRHTTMRLILALATQFSWPLRQLDIKNAFRHGDLEEDVYMKQPQGFVDATCPGYVCKLVKSLYGLKQAPRAWNSKFTSYLPAVGFQSSSSDSSLFVKIDGSDIILLLLYVDDIILTGSDSTKIQSVIDDIAGVFDLKDMGRLTYFLGLPIQYRDDGSLFISQAKYAKDVLKKAGIDTCKSTSTPSHSVNMVCQFMAKPTDLHMVLVKRILRYIQGTIGYGLHYTKSKEFNITAYSDSDWAADINTRRSITGFVVYLGNNPVSWQSKKQSTVSRSSTEAEYKALAHYAADVFWIRSVFKDIHQSISVPPFLYCDNLSAMALSSNPVFHSKIKHLDTDYHFVREKVQRGDLMVHYIPTDDQVANVFTKGLHSPIFHKHCRSLGLGISSAANLASVAQLSLWGE